MIALLLGYLILKFTQNIYSGLVSFSLKNFGEPMNWKDPRQKIGLIFFIFVVFGVFCYSVLDQQIAFYMDDHVSIDTRNACNMISFLVDPLVLPLYLLTLLKLLEHSSKYVKSLITFGAATVTTNALIPLIKFTLARPRPTFFLTHGTSHIMPLHFGENFVSMPSGHAAACGIIAVIILHMAKGHYKKLALLPLVFALLRVISLKHFLSDVVVGFGIGVTITLFFIYSNRTFIDKFKDLLWKDGKIV